MWPEIRKFASELPLVGPALRSAYRKAHGLPDVEGAQSDAPDFRYHAWIERRVRDRAVDYPAPAENAPRFDILTLVYNTDPDVLRKTAASVFAQDFLNYRWVIWDNGSSKPETRAALTEIAKDSRVHFHRSEQNLGITTGHLKALELCNAEYIALLDHDDLLYPDALRINAWHIDFFARPDFLYSDEDKCDMQDRRYWPYFKPDFSPALLLDTGYTCHLSVVKRETLLACGAFTDPSVEGAQDWDMALRIQDFLKLNYKDRIVHIPEMLYTWRGVPESTAVRGVDAKPHVIAAQKRCVESALERRGLRECCIVEPSSLFPDADGHWRIQIKSDTALSSGDAEAKLCFSLFPDAALIVGRSIEDNQNVVGGPIFIGADGALSVRDAGVDTKERDYFCMNQMHTNISAFLNAPFRGRAGVLEQKNDKDFPSLWLAELCARLIRAGKQIVYSPFILEKAKPAPKPSEEELLRFIRAHHDLIRDDPYYSPFCSLKSESLYSIVEPAERAAVLNPLFEKAGVPLVPTDRYEMARYKRLRRKNP